MLLPDGRVLSAGDDYWSIGDARDPWVKPAGTPLDQAEIYSPPYLFDGDTLAPRPGITRCHRWVRPAASSTGSGSASA